MKCPKCGEELKAVSADAIVDAGVKYCINIQCKGWYCFSCDRWHSYGTSCSVAQVRGDKINTQEDYDNWCREHKEDILRMLKDSGYYNHWHDVDKYYPKDETEDTG